MGYDSTFSGSLHPNKPIPDEIVQIINGSDRDVCVQPSCDDEVEYDYDGEPGDIVPSSRNMHGYNLAEDVYRVNRLLGEHGIKLSGALYRAGDDSTDHERVSVRGGRVYTSQAEFVYRNKREITNKDITNYAVRVVRQTIGKNGKPQRTFVGWLVKVLSSKAKIVRCAKTYDTIPPPLTVSRFSDENGAIEAAKEIEAKGVVCDVIHWEDPL